MRPTVVYDRILRPALQLAGLAALAVTGASPVAFALAWALPYLPTLVLGALALRRLTTASPRSWTAEPAMGGPGVQDHGRPELSARAFWAFSAPRAVAGVAQLALNRVDVVLVAALAGLPAAALYTVAGRFVVLGQFVNQAISQAIQPRLAESLATADLPAAKRLYQQGTAWLVLATWPLYLLVGAYAPVYLALFGRHYAAGAAITALLAAAMLVATGCGMVDMVLAMGGRTSWNLGNVALALAVTVGADLLLIPRYGPLGAAFGLAAAVLGQQPRATGPDRVRAAPAPVRPRHAQSRRARGRLLRRTRAPDPHRGGRPAGRAGRLRRRRHHGRCARLRGNRVPAAPPARADQCKGEP
jgi:O-antigen/teichoic acid export membrane protein